MDERKSMTYTTLEIVEEENIIFSPSDFDLDWYPRLAVSGMKPQTHTHEQEKRCFSQEHKRGSEVTPQFGNDVIGKKKKKGL